MRRATSVKIQQIFSRQSTLRQNRPDHADTLHITIPRLKQKLQSVTPWSAGREIVPGRKRNYLSMARNTRRARSWVTPFRTALYENAHLTIIPSTVACPRNGSAVIKRLRSQFTGIEAAQTPPAGRCWSVSSTHPAAKRRVRPRSLPGNHG